MLILILNLGPTGHAKRCVDAKADLQTQRAKTYVDAKADLQTQRANTRFKR